VTLAFRNVTTDPASPVETWPSEAVRAALERGDIRDWARLGAAIRRDPWGRTARQVEEILGHSHPYGDTELMTAVIARARARAQQAEREAVAAEIRDAVDRSGLTRTEFAGRIGTSASRLSTYLSGSVTPSAALMVRIRRVVDG
jgi:DNA-binding transcriptional regulator YiaG